LLLKNIESFLCKQKLVNNRSIPSMHIKRKNIVRSHKHSFTPYPSLSPYWQIDRVTDGGMNALAVGGLEEHYFPVVLLCQFFSFWQEIGFDVTYLRI
jgi:hypothetical protein